MISEEQKTEIRNRLLPYWLFYNIKHEVLDIAYEKMAEDFTSVGSYESLIRQIIQINETLFIKNLAQLERKTFINEIKDQYNNYYLKCKDMNDWLECTSKLVTNGLSTTKINLESKSEFIKWYKKKTKGTNKQLEIDLISNYRNALRGNVEIILKRNHEDNIYNELYYVDQIFEFKKRLNIDIKENELLRIHSTELTYFNLMIKESLENTVLVFRGCHKLSKGETTNYQRNIYLLKENLGNLSNFTSVISNLLVSKRVTEAIDIRAYCLNQFERSLNFLSNHLLIDVQKCELKVYFNEVRYKLQNSINFEEIRVVNELDNGTPTNLENTKSIKSKLDFHIDKIRTKFITIIELKEIEKPSLILDTLLQEVKEFKECDLKFEVDFYHNIFQLSKENANNIFYQNHREDILRWLRKCPIKQLIFETIWDNFTLPQQTKTNKSDEVFAFENNFDRVSNKAVYNFFNTELVEKKYLSIQDLQTFLKMAFENQEHPQTKFNFKKKYLIKNIRVIFYKYFSEINKEKYNTQDRYIRLLTDYFEGFEFEKIKSNFNK